MVRWLLYADDLVLFCKSIAEVKTIMNILNGTCSRFGLTISFPTTKTQVFNNDELANLPSLFSIGENVVEYVSEFNTLAKRSAIKVKTKCNLQCKLMMWIMFRDKSIIGFFKFPFCAGYRYKSKTLWATLKTTVSSTQSPNLVSNRCYFPQVGLGEAPGCPDEVLNLCAKFFHHEHSIVPTSCPWVSEDGPFQN